MAFPGPITYPAPGVYPVDYSTTGGTGGTGGSGGSGTGGSGGGGGSTGTPSGVYAPTLTAYTDLQPRPRVKILFTSLDPACVTLNVYRQARARQMPVRGGLNVAVAGGLGLIDAEVPNGIPLLYIGQQFDIDGVFIGNTGTAQITVHGNVTTVHNPFDPDGVVTGLRVSADTGQTVAGAATVAPYYPTGRRAGIAITGQRYGLPNATVKIGTSDLATADQLDAMFGPVNGDLGLPPIVCICFAESLVNRIRLPQPLFLAVASPTQLPINLLAGGTRIWWDLSGPEVDPPAASLSQAVYSRDDMDAAFLTRNTRDQAYATRLQMDTDFNNAGLSG